MRGGKVLRIQFDGLTVFLHFLSHKPLLFSEIFCLAAKCEIISCGNCEISHAACGSVRCEMKFARIRASEYFTFAKQIFHSVAISLARRANFVEKSLTLCVRLFSGAGGGT